MPMASLRSLFAQRRQYPSHHPLPVWISDYQQLFQALVGIDPVNGSRIVQEIAISSPDPRSPRASPMPTSTDISSIGFKLRARPTKKARKFLESKLGELKDRVENSEMTLNQFRRGKGIISLDEKENIVVDRLADLNRRLTESEADRIGFEAQARLIKNRQYDSLPAVISNPLIQTLRSLQVVQLEAELAKLSDQFLPGYPRVAQIKAQLEESKTRLAQQIKNVVDGINSAYLAAAGKERELRVQMDNQKSETFALKDASVQYAILGRDANTNKQLYDNVLERFREISVAGELPSSNVTIVDRAEIPRLPAKPNKRLNLMLGAFLGLFGGLGLALVLEHLDNTLNTEKYAERLLWLPCLAVVPDIFTLPQVWRTRLRRRFAGWYKAPSSCACRPGI